MKKPTLTIGIPAYNEEANIGILLTRLLAQKLKHKAVFKKILVISDGSTDRTVDIAKSIKSPLILVIEAKKRMGQQARQNQILSMSKSDITVIIEADTLPYNQWTISNLITPLLKDSPGNIGMVVGKAISLSPVTFVEKVEVHGMKIKNNIFSEWKRGINIYASNGHAMKALSKEFSLKLYWPNDVPEDSFTYLSLVQMKLRIAMRSDAKTYVKRAGTVTDSIKRNKKYVRGRVMLEKYFSSEFIKREFSYPTKLAIKHLFYGVINSPILTFLFLFESVLVRVINFRVKEYNPLGDTFISTKNLYTPRNEAKLMF